MGPRPRPRSSPGSSRYPGSAHRQELIATIDGVRYVNDSKATNADAAAKALACYDPIYWIIGGRAKEGGPRRARSLLSARAPRLPDRRVRQRLRQAAARQAAISRNAARWIKAVAAASAEARKERKPGATVLLSPACASWDQYPNFEARGDHFRALVHALSGQKTGGKGRHDEFHARRPLRRRAVVVDGRSLDPGDRRRADVHGRDPGAGRQPGGRDAHRARQLAHGAPALCDAAAAFAVVLGVSMLSPKQVRRLGVLLFLLFLGLTALTPRLRHRDQGRDALDLGRAVLPAALGIPEADLRDLRRLDVLAENERAAGAGQPHRHRRLRAGGVRCC